MLKVCLLLSPSSLRFSGKNTMLSYVCIPPAVLWQTRNYKWIFWDAVYQCKRYNYPRCFRIQPLHMLNSRIYSRKPLYGFHNNPFLSRRNFHWQFQSDPYGFLSVLSVFLFAKAYSVFLFSNFYLLLNLLRSGQVFLNLLYFHIYIATPIGVVIP